MISIILPYHKGPHFLKDCLESLSSQTYKEFELLLIEDDVDDDIEKIVSDAQKHLTIHRYPVSFHNVAKARNYGLSHALGEYVYFMDSDDYINPTTLELLVSRIQANQDQLVYGPFIQTWLQKKSYFELEQSDKEKEVKEQLEKLDLHPLVGKTDVSSWSEEEKQMAICFFTPDRTIGYISALNVLFDRTWLVNQKIQFDEKTELYCDLTFILTMLQRATKRCCVSDAYYMKRYHNDPINYPSINQRDAQYRFDEMFESYARCASVLQMKDVVAYCLQCQLLSYITERIMLKYDEDPDKRFRGEYYSATQNVVSAMDKELLCNFSGYKKRMAFALHAKNRKRVNLVLRIHQIHRKTELLFTQPNFLQKFIYKRLCKLSILNNVVVFESFLGKSYSDSPKYIYEYLAKTYPGKYHFVWSMSRKDVKLPYEGTVVKRFGLRYVYYLARAKYFVFNVRQPKWYKRRKGAIFLDTWHGTPLKRLVFHQLDVTGASPLYKQQFYTQSRQWNYLISPNDFCTDIFESAFMFDRDKIVPCGYPRNDILYTRNNEVEINKIKDKLDIPHEKKVILYAPTWRDDQYAGIGQYLFRLQLDLDLMRKKLGQEYVIVLRTHYFVSSQLDLKDYKGFAFNASSYNDISELYLISDILITDYSSVFFDYANLRRPMLFFTYDLEKYRDTLRGFYFDMEQEVPGPLLKTSEEIVDSILHIDEVKKKYAKRYDEFYKKFCHLDDGHASERIAELVFNGKDFRE